MNDYILCLGTDPAQPSGSIIRVSKHNAPAPDLVAPALEKGNHAIPATVTHVSPTRPSIASTDEHVEDPTINERENPTEQLEDLMTKQAEGKDPMDDVLDLTDVDVGNANCSTAAEQPSSSKS